MSCSRLLARSLCLLVLLSSTLCLRKTAYAAEPHWIRIDSSHFSVLTDADQNKGRDVDVRFEQMRAVFAQLLLKSRVNMSEPIEIIAFKSEDEYAKVAPVRQGRGLGSAFFLAGKDRDYFVLNLSNEESWRAVSGEFARVLLTFNYPPTPLWFDEGFVEYFSSLYLNNKQMQIGGDPATSTTPSGKSDAGAPQKSFVELLSTSPWLTVSDLFTRQPGTSASPTGSHDALFDAQAWIVMHYLLNQDKLSATGTYFGLVENEKVPVGDAIQKVFGMTAAQFEQAVKDYFHALAPTIQGQKGAVGGKAVQANLMPAPVTADAIGSSVHEILEAEARARVAEMSLRLPEHREQALAELESIVNQPATDNGVAHRALAWDHIEKREFDKAVDELNKAIALDPKDPWTHYYLASVKYEEAQSTAGETKGLANMMQDLHIVLDWDHEFAGAQAMLAKAQMEGGGLHAATDSIRAAIQLSPRNPDYLLQLAQIYEAGKNWDAATALLERLSTNANPQVATAAKKELQDLPYLKKYGVPPQAASEAGKGPAPKPPASTTQPQKPRSQNTQTAAEPSAEELEQLPAEPKIDKRPIQYLKGKLISVDCSQAPAATLTVAAGTRVLKLRAADYKSLPLIGADQFSCSWTSLQVSANYKSGGKADGDLVSLELR